MIIKEFVTRDFAEKLQTEKNEGLTTNKNVPVMRKYNTLIDMMKSINPHLSNEIVINAALDVYYKQVMPEVRDFLDAA